MTKIRSGSILELAFAGGSPNGRLGDDDKSAGLEAAAL